MLALQLGMTVSALTEQMTAAEEAHWIALWKLSPWGTHADDMQNALIAQLLYNSNAKKGKTKKLDEFLLFSPKRRPAGNSTDQIRQNFSRLIAAQRKRGIK